MRLIDADELIEALDKGLEENSDIMDAIRKQLLVGFAKQILNDSPTVDAVPVVRCKDCKHSAKCMLLDDVLKCHRTYATVGINHYCAWGERREDGQD